MHHQHLIFLLFPLLFSILSTAIPLPLPGKTKTILDPERDVAFAEFLAKPTAQPAWLQEPSSPAPAPESHAGHKKDKNGKDIEYQLTSPRESSKSGNDITNNDDDNNNESKTQQMKKGDRKSSLDTVRDRMFDGGNVVNNKIDDNSSSSKNNKHKNNDSDTHDKKKGNSKPKPKGKMDGTPKMRSVGELLQTADPTKEECHFIRSVALSQAPRSLLDTVDPLFKACDRIYS